MSQLLLGLNVILTLEASWELEWDVLLKSRELLAGW